MKDVKLPDSLMPWRKAFIDKVERLLRLVSRYLTPDETEEVERACIFGAFAHQEQSRSSGEPYIFHPLAVALILTEVQIDAPSIIGAILHDVIEDTKIDYAEIESRFGTDVANIVDGVTKLTQIKFSSKEEAKAENFRKMILAMTKDLRVIMVKLADRLHNMRTLGALAPYKKRRIANDTLEIYAPIASRLGMYVLQVQLENLCFENLYPMRARVLKKAIDDKFEGQSSNLNQIRERIEDRLVRVNIISRISMRKKHLWSVYKKLKLKGNIDQVYDIFAIRIIVRTIDDCYRCLGIVHQLFKPIIGRFKDFIAIPKKNGYQSLHTVVFGANNLPVEIQIRTRDMHVIAETGAAAHWRYKEAYEGQAHTLSSTSKWIDSVSELQDDISSSEEFMESMKAELFPKEIYVFTPKGKIIELPRGATPIDFAYAVHTDIGDSCASAKIDAKHVELTQPLRNGQTVEISVSDKARPSSIWLDHVVTARARTKIRSYLASLSREEAYNAGKNLLESALRERGISVKEITEAEGEEMIKELNLGSKEDLFVNIGYGKYPAQYVINRFLINQHYDASGDVPQTSLEDGVAISNIAIKGAEGMRVSLGRCCYPLPGEAILGYLSMRQGMVIHLVNCMNVDSFKKHQERWIPLEWSKNTDGEFPVRLFLIAKNRRGSIAAISAKITEMNIDIDEFICEPINEDLVKIQFVIKVNNRKHLARVMRGLRLLDNIERVSRK